MVYPVLLLVKFFLLLSHHLLLFQQSLLELSSTSVDRWSLEEVLSEKEIIQSVLGRLSLAGILWQLLTLNQALLPQHVGDLFL